MATHGKRYNEAAKLVDPKIEYKLDQAVEVYEAGCSRIGTTSTAAILDEWQARLTPPAAS